MSYTVSSNGSSTFFHIVDAAASASSGIAVDVIPENAAAVAAPLITFYNNYL